MSAVTVSANVPNINTKPKIDFPMFCLLGLFFVDLGVASGSERVMSRTTVVVAAILGFVFLVAGLASLWLRHVLERPVFSQPVELRATMRLIYCWLGICIVDVVIGVIYANSVSYLIGDFYKFTKWTLTFALAFFCIESEPQARMFLRRFGILLGLLLLSDFVQGRAQIAAHERLTTTTALFGCFFIPIQIYQIQQKENKKLFSVLLLLTIGIVILGQARGTLLVGLIGVGTYFVFSKRRAGKRRSLLFPLLILLIGMAIFWFSFGDLISQYLMLFAQRFARISKFLNRTDEATLVFGSRIPEILAVIGRYQESPINLLWGFGMGAQIVTYTGLLTSWGPTHFIHSGITSILLIGGIPLMATYILFNLHVIRRAFKRRKVSNFMVLVLALGVEQFLITGIGFPFISSDIVLAFFAMMLRSLIVDSNAV